MTQAFSDQNRLLGVGGYLTLLPYLIVDSGLQNPHSQGMFQTFSFWFDPQNSIDI
jgi:hypothetical protein